MILPDDTPPSPSKSQQALLGGRTSDSNSHTPEQNNPPPAYPGYASYQRNHPLPQASAPRRPLPIPPVRSPQITVYDEPAGRRFVKAFCVAILIWTLLGLFTRSIIEIGSPRHRNWDKHSNDDNEHDWENPSNSWPNSSDGIIHDCVRGRSAWSSGSEKPRAFFEIPLSSEALYIFSRGPLASGQIIVQEDFNEGSNAKIGVEVKSWARDAFSGMAICSLERRVGERGIGLFAPGSRVSNEVSHSEFLVTVRIPTNHFNPTRIPAFETNLPRFSHNISITKDQVTFGSFSVKSSGAPITAHSLSAENVTLETSYGAIIGQFSTSTSLTLITSNAPIDVAVDLLHDDKRLPTSLYMHTSNGRVGSTINLKSTSPSQSGGSYTVTAQTSNSPAVLTFPTSPLLSTLYLLSQTSNSPSHITLDKAYEGKFELHTSNGGIGVQHNEKTMDPAGRGRKRNLGILRAGMRYAIGEVYWGNKDGEKGKGNVVARTSNSPIVLELA